MVNAAFRLKSLPTPIIDIPRQSCPLIPAAFASASTMLPNRYVQPFSENILEVQSLIDYLDQHKLQAKKQR